MSPSNEDTWLNKIKDIPGVLHTMATMMTEESTSTALYKPSYKKKVPSLPTANTIKESADS